MRACQLALISAFLLAVSAKVKISKPVEGTVWNFGNKETVAWKCVDDTDKGPAEIELFFTNGQDPNNLRSKPIATKSVDKLEDGTAEFDLSNIKKEDFPPSVEEYFIRIGGKEGSYSHLFTINGGTGTGASTSGNSTTTTGPESGSSGSTTSDNNGNGSTTGNTTNPGNSTDTTTTGNDNAGNNTTGAGNNNGNTGNNNGNTGNNNNNNGPSGATIANVTTGTQNTNTNNQSNGSTKTIASSFFAVAVACAAFLL